MSDRNQWIRPTNKYISTRDLKQLILHKHGSVAQMYIEKCESRMELLELYYTKAICIECGYQNHICKFPESPCECPYCHANKYKKTIDMNGTYYPSLLD